MSESTAVAVIVIIDVTLIGLVAWLMCHPRYLRPHVSARADEAPAPEEQTRRFSRDGGRTREGTDRRLVG